MVWSDDGGEVRRSKPHVKTNCELASSHSEERGTKEGRGEKETEEGREEEMMPLGSIESQFGCSILHYHGQIKQLERKCCN